MKFDANVTDVNSLLVSGTAVMIDGVGSIAISGSNATQGTLNFVGARAFNVGIAGRTITVDAPSSTSGGLSGVVQDTSPQLGGNLNANSHNISNVGTETINTSLTVSGIPVNTKAANWRINFADPNSTAAMTWTNMPSAVTFLFGLSSIVEKTDLSVFTQVRLTVNKAGTSGASGSALRLRYLTSFSVTATDYLDMTTVGSPQVAINTTNTMLDSGWQTLIPAARADVFLAVVGSGGNGVTDPVLGEVVADFK